MSTLMEVRPNIDKKVLWCTNTLEGSFIAPIGEITSSHLGSEKQIQRPLVAYC